MDSEWWKKVVIYQIYPRSFQDSNGDGVGDIPGIIERLDYLKELGVGAVWLNPIFESPNDDNGYDISDYRAIQAKLGTMDDFDRLVRELHNRQIKLIMDLVVNHTSDEHSWFKQSNQPENNHKSDYYIWRPGKGDQPPNNWQSFFGGSAWEFSPTRGMYYLHLFSRKQPDLNWENPAVRQEVREIIRFWLEKGVNGFRMDVINLISKRAGFPDGDDRPGITGQEHFTNGPRIREYLAFIKDSFEGYEVMTIGETVLADLDTVAEYVNPESGYLNMAISFDHVDLDRGEGPLDPLPFIPSKLKSSLARWQTRLDGHGWNCLYLTNHDQPRQLSRFGNEKTYRIESAKMLATLLHTLQGTPFIMQGEEIGMTNAGFDAIDQYRDIATLKHYQEQLAKGEDAKAVLDRIKSCSRDNSRTPVQWDNSTNAGFTTGAPWIDINPNFSEINVAQQLYDPNSILNYYKQLIQLRQEFPIFALGSFQEHDRENPSVFLYQRKYKGSVLTIALNLTGQTIQADLSGVGSIGSPLIYNYPKPPHLTNEIDLRPFEAVVWLRE